MAFVNEREKFRVIDYERNVYITAGQKPAIRNPDVYGWDLHWNNEVIYFAAYYTQNQGADGQWEITWTVFQCIIPDHLRTPENKKIIKGLISEALDTFGVFFGKEEVARQNFAVDPHLKAFE